MERKTRVLYAEDSASDADLTRTHFARAAPDFSLEVVDRGRECVARLEVERYDALLLDYRLPDMDGVDVLRALAAKELAVPVVVTTAVGDEALVIQLLRLGACDYVPKQGDYIEKLPTVLKNAIDDFGELQQRWQAGGRTYRRILYIERHYSDIDLTLKHISEAAPHLHLEVIRSAANALARLQSGDIDLVVTDLRLPDMTALDLLREAKQRGFHAPFIVVTGGGDENMATAALKLGAYDYLVKRDNYITQLPYAIDNALSRFKLLRELRERQQMQKSTAEMLALLDTLQIHAPIGIGFIDRDYRFQRINEELAAIDGVTASEHIGRTVAEIVPEIWPTLEPIYRKVLAGEHVHNVEISGMTAARPGEERQWMASYSPVRRQGQEVIGIGVFVSEITERKRAEAVLRERTAELTDNARQKDEFLAMLGHELRNPLASISTALEVLRRSTEAEVVSHAHDVMNRQIGYMGRLLDDLLDVSRISSGRIKLNLEDLDLRQIIAEAIDACRPLIEARRHTLETSTSPGRLLVRGDMTRLVQVLVNLLNNAAKYTDEGGTIQLTTTSADGQAVLRVADTGAGIPARLLPKIFDLFTQDDRTLDRAQGGLGLGLTLVRKIAELHGGQVEAHSKGRGQGSQFIVRLPLLTSTTVSISSDTRPTRGLSPKPIRCLVVEDNVDAANMLKIALELEGHEVRLALDGRDAIDAARTFLPDAVVLDIGLPRLNGYDAARAIRQLPGLSTVHIIAATGYGQDADREKSREAGINQHFVKPIELDMLLRALTVGRPTMPI